MEISKVLEHFGGVQSRIADVLGLAKSTVNAWQRLPVGAEPGKGEPDTRPVGVYVPEICAMRLHNITRGRLKFEPELYDRLYKRKLVPYAHVRKSVLAKSTTKSCKSVTKRGKRNRNGSGKSAKAI